LPADKLELEGIAAELSANRTKAIPVIQEKVLANLSEMGMPNSVLQIEQNPVARTGPERGRCYPLYVFGQ
jgi:DNA repair protein RecN (Recombination protein N)